MSRAGVTDDPGADRKTGHRVCPWWLGYVLASPLRRMMQDPASIVEPYVRPGMTVLEPGPGMGFFTPELARRVGPTGHVVAVDIQSRMISGLKRRLARAGLLERVDARLGTTNSLSLGDLNGRVDFTLAMAVVHEMPSGSWFFGQMAAAMKPGGTLLLAEPSGHVSDAKFQAEMEEAISAGFEVVERPAIRRSQAALLRKKAA